MPSQVVQSGEYTLEIDTGFTVNGFRLNDPVAGVLGNTVFVLDGSTDWADLTQYVTDITYKRGRANPDDQFGSGTMSFTMLDNVGVLNPFDPDSPYFSIAQVDFTLAPLRKVRLKRESTYLFTGKVINYDYQYAVGDLDRVTVNCSDDFYLLAQTQIDAYNPSAETSGQRISTILALPEVDYAGPTDIDPGTVNLGHDSAYNIPQGTNTLAYLQQINEAEQGRLFVAADGEIVFQPRLGATFSAPSITFSDEGSFAKYSGVGIAFDADEVVNRTYVKALDGKDATDSDAASIAKYFIQSKSITNSLLHDQSEIDALAAYLLVAEPQPRYTSVTTTFSRLTEAQRDTVAALEIGDTITISKLLKNSELQLGQELAIEGMQGSINVATGHEITFYTNPTTIVFEFILSDPTYGKLDSNNALA